MEDSVDLPRPVPATVASSLRRLTERGERIRLCADSHRRRTHGRYEVRGVVALAGSFRGLVVDLSAGGLCVLTTTSVKPGQNLSFRLVGEEQSAVAARVCWSHLEMVRKAPAAEPRTVYRAGLELLHDPRRLTAECPSSWQEALGKLPSGRETHQPRRQNGRKVDL